jgi:hypothetical protein
MGVGITARVVGSNIRAKGGPGRGILDPGDDVVHSALCSQFTRRVQWTLLHFAAARR